MCLTAGPFLLITEDREISLDHVSSLIPGETALTAIDAFGKSTVYPGRIEEIDLLNQRIVLSRG